MGPIGLILSLDAVAAASRQGAFDWEAAAIGAVTAAGALLLALGIALVVLRARSATARRPPGTRKML